MLDVLGNEDIATVAELRQANIGNYLDANLLLEQSGSSELAAGLDAGLPELNMTLGELIDAVAQNPDVQAHREDSTTLNSTIGELIELAGEDKVADILQNKNRRGQSGCRL